nr:MAG TPA: hypothetical protein [Caudoviricetes sp.]
MPHIRIGSCPIVIFLLILWLFSIFFVILHPVIHLLRRDHNFCLTFYHP